jgi:hypothetical protein
MNAVLQAGLLVRLVHFRAHWDGDLPKPGDYVRSIYRNRQKRFTAYEIVTVRPSRSTRYPLRLGCRRVALEDIPSDAKVHLWKSDRPMRRRPLRSPLI